MSREEKIFKKQPTYQKKYLACFSSVKCLLSKNLTGDNLLEKAGGGGGEHHQKKPSLKPLKNSY